MLILIIRDGDNQEDRSPKHTKRQKRRILFLANGVALISPHGE
jgi:hypothetical protein